MSHLALQTKRPTTIMQCDSPLASPLDLPRLVFPLWWHTIARHVRISTAIHFLVESVQLASYVTWNHGGFVCVMKQMNTFQVPHYPKTPDK